MNNKFKKDLLLGYHCATPFHEVQGDGFLDFLKPIVNVVKPFVKPVLEAIPGVLDKVHESKKPASPSINDKLMEIYNSTDDPKIKMEILKQLQKI